MITGFTIETAPLSQHEIDVVLPRLLSGFHRSEDASVPSSRIIEKLSREGIKITGPRLRKLINHIRTHDLIACLVGDDKGYRVEKDPDQIKEYLDGLRSRIDAIQNVHTKMQRQYEKIKNPSSQANLFGPSEAAKDALDTDTGTIGRQAVLGHTVTGQDEGITTDAPKTRAQIAAADWWQRENKIQYGR